MRKIVGDKKAINRLSLGKVLITKRKDVWIIRQNLGNIYIYTHTHILGFMAKVKPIKGKWRRLECRKSSNYIARAYGKEDDTVYWCKYPSFVPCSLQEPENSSRNPLSSVTGRCDIARGKFEGTAGFTINARNKEYIMHIPFTVNATCFSVYWMSVNLEIDVFKNCIYRFDSNYYRY